MPNAYYTCDLLPLALIAHAGYTPRWLGRHLQDPGAPARRDALSIHPMTCPYVTRLVAAADALFDKAGDTDVLLVPGGCDAMRRLGDLLAATYPGRVFVLSLGRSGGEDAAAALAADLARLDRWLRERTERTGPAALGAQGVGAGVVDTGAGAVAKAGAEAGAAPGAAPGAAAVIETPQVDYATQLRPGGVFVVAGPLTDNSLLGLIGQLGAEVSGLESCTSPDRWKLLAAAGAPAGADAGGADEGAAPAAEAAPTVASDPYRALAREVLSLGLCPRRSTTERRYHLARRLDESRPASVIYARQSFCDPGAYDALLVAELAQERGLPFLEIEVGFPFEASGPLRTRVEAFLEAQLLDDDLLDED